MLSGFSFVYNGLKAGMPVRESIRATRDYVDEIVIVDAGSNDGTRELLESMPEVDRILDAEWGTDGGETLKRLHAMHIQCKNDIILHWEMDEVFDESLLINIQEGIVNYSHHWLVSRIQIEQNFQKVRWYPEYVHRVFTKGSVIKEGHTTDFHHMNDMPFLVNSGFLWDITNCFRDNFIDRIEQQAELRKDTETPEPNYLMVPLHCAHPVKLTREEVEQRLKEDHWTWTDTPRS